MAHCSHILAPPCAWAATAHPKPTPSVRKTSRLGDAIRALTPRRTRKAKKDVDCESLTVDVVTELNDWHCPVDKMKRRWSESEDEISTQLGASSSTASIEEVTSLPGSVEEIPMPSSTSSLSDRSASCDEEDAKPDLCGKRSITHQLHQMALLIARKAASKFSGRVSTDVRQAFMAVDENGDGKLTPTEMATFCRHFDLTSEIATRLFSLLDPDETGVADWSSFLARYAPVFRQNTTFRLNPVDPFHPALQ